MSGAIVSIENITKQYPAAQQPAVSDVTLQIPDGSVFGLLGPNGAGKSSLIMMLCGLLKPDSGSISVLGWQVQSNGSNIRKNIGVAPQEIALFPALTAQENLHYFGRMYGLPSSFLRKAIPNYLDTFGLLHKANKRVETFSGGMKRRLNLIAALLHEPKLIILDEPTTGVDVQSRTMILDFLQTLKAKNVTIIYSSHFLEEAERICSHLAILDEGKLITTGKKEMLMASHPDCRTLEDLFLKLTGKRIRD
jgi:ABC-2 type transport system ATP-binding protein